MENSNLVKLFKSFTAKEMKEFMEFVGSPFYNTNPNVIALFNILRKHYPSFKSRSVEKKKIFSVIYSAEKYKDSKMRLLVFYLNELAEKFLINKNLYNNTLGHEVLLLNELGRRNLRESFEKAIRRAYVKKSEAELKDSDYLINKFHIELHHLNYFSRVPSYN